MKRFDINFRKFGLNEWLGAGNVLIACICLICYGITPVGEFSAAPIVLFVSGVLFSLISIFLKFPYFDLIAFVLYTIAFFLFIESKAFYISAVFVGIDYKSFDVCFILNFIFGIMSVICSAAAALPFDKTKNN